MRQAVRSRRSAGVAAAAGAGPRCRRGRSCWRLCRSSRCGRGLRSHRVRGRSAVVQERRHSGRCRSRSGRRSCLPARRSPHRLRDLLRTAGRVRSRQASCPGGVRRWGRSTVAAVVRRGPCRVRRRLLCVRGVVDAARLRRTWVACCWRRLFLLLEEPHGCGVVVSSVEGPSRKMERLLLRLRLNNGCGVSCRSLGQQHRV
jgi:hypothetical protein